MNKPQTETRRGFLQGLARLAAGGALAAMTGVLTWRGLHPEPATTQAGHSCDRDFICSRCGLAESCILPQALSAREAQAAAAKRANHE